MFYLSYLKSELLRRKGRTILTVLGLALAVALVITISSLSRGLNRAQRSALDPLSSIGTDLTVTLAPTQPDAAGGGFPGGGGGGGGFAGGGFGGGGEVARANASAITDLSKLGKPGTHFVHDFFLPGTQLTFPQAQAQGIKSLPGVAAVSSGLVLSGVHQEGTVPKIVAKLKTGGQQLTVTGRVRFQLTQAERDKIQACFEKLQTSGGAPATPAAGTALAAAGSAAAAAGAGRAGSTGARSPSACRRRCGTTAGRSRRHSRRSSRSSTRPRPTSRARATRSAASTRRSRGSGSSPRRCSRAAAS